MTTPNLNKALAQAQLQFKPITFNATAKVQLKSGGSYEFSYADLPKILDCTREALSKNGLSISSRVAEHQVWMDLRHESGEMITSCLPIKSLDRPQELGSILTYYRRYLLCGLLGIAAEEDDDANVAEDNEAEFTRKGQSTTPPPAVKPPKGQPKGALAKHTIHFGPDKGKTFEELGVSEISKKVSQLKFSKADFAKTKMAQDFIKEATEWLKIGASDDLDAALGPNTPPPESDFMNEPMPEWGDKR